MEQKDLAVRIAALENKLALQQLTHNYLAAADRKNPLEMAAHFTQDGVLTSVMPDSTIVLDGRQGIADGFEKILAPITTAYHLAGQLITTINGNEATGTSYAFVTLVSKENNRQYVRKIWAVYNDTYVKNANQWLIQKRIATVAWEENN